MKQLFFTLGSIVSLLFSPSLLFYFRSARKYFYTGLYKRAFREFGKGSVINPSFLMLFGAKYISVGRNCYIGSNVQLSAWDSMALNGSTYIPSIVIGDGTSIGDESHITAINKITFGENVLLGKKVLISDNAHGFTSLSNMRTPPLDRKMFSKGEVVIGNNVWIGEKSSILANVHIGEGSIIGANSVVTKDIPAFCVAAGNPAKVLKTITE